ncbi:hypothetical protein NLJ89_g935 [Agrocybe chaxingu]|uniref:Uncharacterized protein n=1 Tax=Agrocybe chaxingu TaxID=84603 RepID=A0A9W8TFZ7_9AGAR|nr:hypothetical protein NLJ89_g935 [Agrocybe chaxingu]
MLMKLTGAPESYSPQIPLPRGIVKSDTRFYLLHSFGSDIVKAEKLAFSLAWSKDNFTAWADAASSWADLVLQQHIIFATWSCEDGSMEPEDLLNNIQEAQKSISQQISMDTFLAAHHLHCSSSSGNTPPPPSEQAPSPASTSPPEAQEPSHLVSSSPHPPTIVPAHHPPSPVYQDQAIQAGTPKLKRDSPPQEQAISSGCSQNSNPTHPIPHTQPPTPSTPLSLPIPTPPPSKLEKPNVAGPPNHAACSQCGSTWPHSPSRCRRRQRRSSTSSGTPPETVSLSQPYHMAVMAITEVLRGDSIEEQRIGGLGDERRRGLESDWKMKT